jgi:hypothetical protein
MDFRRSVHLPLVPRSRSGRRPRDFSVRIVEPQLRLVWAAAKLDERFGAVVREVQTICSQYRPVEPFSSLSQIAGSFALRSTATPATAGVPIVILA